MQPKESGAKASVPISQDTGRHVDQASGICSTGSDTYVLYYYSEGVAEAPTWALSKFGNNQGANSITPTHNFLSTASMTGLHIEYVSGSSQTVNGTQYPPANALGGTMVIG